MTKKKIPCDKVVLSAVCRKLLNARLARLKQLCDSDHRVTTSGQSLSFKHQSMLRYRDGVSLGAEVTSPEHMFRYLLAYRRHLLEGLPIDEAAAEGGKDDENENERGGRGGGESSGDKGGGWGMRAAMGEQKGEEEKIGGSSTARERTARDKDRDAGTESAPSTPSSSPRSRRLKLKRHRSSKFKPSCLQGSNRLDTTVEHWAASEFFDVFLLDGGVNDVPKGSPNGFTPLRFAVMLGDLDLVSELIAMGANLHTATDVYDPVSGDQG